MRFLVRLLITAAALWVATRVVSGISATGGWLALFGVALVFGVLNALVRPVLKLLTCPLIILTLGLFIFVLNGVMLLLTSAVSSRLGLGFHVAGFRAAFWGAIVVSLVSIVLTMLVPDPDPSADEH